MSRVARRLLTTLIAIGASCVLQCAPSLAEQTWPSRSMTWVVPFPAGGTVDQSARLMSDHLREKLGWQIVILNKPGASGMIGTETVARARPDGYTWGFVFDTHVTNPTIQPNITYDTATEFQPVLMLGRVPFLIVTHPKTPYANFAEVVAAARKAPKTIPYGIIGIGSLSHLTIADLQKLYDFELNPVAYRGGPPAVQDVIGAHIPLYIGSPALTIEYIKGGQLRALAYTGKTRSALLPDVPTLSEQGFAGFSAQTFIGVVGPAGMQHPIPEKFEAALRDALVQPRMQKWMQEVAGMEVSASGPQEFKAYLETETARWRRVIKDQNIKLN